MEIFAVEFHYALIIWWILGIFLFLLSALGFAMDAESQSFLVLHLVILPAASFCSFILDLSLNDISLFLESNLIVYLFSYGLLFILAIMSFAILFKREGYLVDCWLSSTPCMLVILLNLIRFIFDGLRSQSVVIILKLLICQILPWILAHRILKQEKMQCNVLFLYSSVYSNGSQQRDNRKKITEKKETP